MKMKAGYIAGFGGPEVFQVGDLDRPTLGPADVLVRIEAAGVNYYDMLVRIGAVTQEMPLPHVPGSDAVGTVEAVGEKVTRWKAGDRVIVAPGFPVNAEEWDTGPDNYLPSYYPGGTFNHGGYAQYMAIHERWLLPNELELQPAETACLPLVLVTAMHAVKQQAEISRGKRVLVHAGASGSGSMAIQVAKALGATVLTTVSTPDKAQIARGLGADETVLYTQDNFADVAREWSDGEGVDAVIDPVGGDTFADSLRALKWGGILVNFGLVAGVEARIPHLYPFFRSQCQIRGCFMGTLDELREGLELVKAGKVRPVLDEAVSLDRVREVHERIDSHKVGGKLVLLPWQ
jgi:NADPH2:quinone reductase